MSLRRLSSVRDPAGRLCSRRNMKTFTPHSWRILCTMGRDKCYCRNWDSPSEAKIIACPYFFFQLYFFHFISLRLMRFAIIFFIRYVKYCHFPASIHHTYWDTRCNCRMHGCLPGFSKFHILRPVLWSEMPD
jgi:hypothetical protein